MIDGEYKLVGLICSHFRMISSRAMSAEEEQMLQGACASYGFALNGSLPYRYILP